MIKRILGFLFILLFTTAVLADLRVHFIDVGQGDAILLQAPEANVLVDGGQGIHARAYLAGQGIDQLDLIVGTHAHADHIGGFIRIFPESQIREIWYNGQTHTTQTFERFIDAVLASNAEYHEPIRGEVREYGRLRLEVLHPEGSAADYTGHLHDKNIVIRAVYGDFAILLTGDAEAEVEHELLETGLDLRAQVLKMGHHGSRTSSSPEFVRAVQPEVAVYQAAKGNRYGHPHKEAIDSVSHVGAQILGTDRYGTIVVETNGKTYTIKTERADPSTKRPEIDAPVKEPVSERCVDINMAGFEELRTIIHMGEERARQIIELRQRRRFNSLDDITRVRGIGQGRLREIREQGIACVE